MEQIKQKLGGVLAQVFGLWGVDAHNGKVNSYRCKWGEFSPKWGLAFTLSTNEDCGLISFCLIWGKFYVRAKWLAKCLPKQKGCMGDYYGFSVVDGDTLHFNWGDNTKIYDLPWRYSLVARSPILKDGSCDFSGKPILPDQILVRTFPVKFTTHSGEVQDRVATVSVIIGRGKMAWFKWLPFCQEWSSIDIKLDQETGNQVGSWKGGTYGVYASMLPNETWEQAVDRLITKNPRI